MKRAFSFVLVFASALVFAEQGGIGAVKVEPNPARAGQEVKITVSAEGEVPGFCGMVVHFDDGSESHHVKVDNTNKFPVTIAKTYAKAGSYIIKAEGTKITTHLPCVGAATARLTVEGAPAAAAPASPAGDKMAGKPGKAGDFTCKGGKGAAKPAAPLACADKLEYFSSDKPMQLGCRKPKAKKK
jgi:hypothetical protein